MHLNKLMLIIIGLFVSTIFVISFLPTKVSNDPIMYVLRDEEFSSTNFENHIRQFLSQERLNLINQINSSLDKLRKRENIIIDDYSNYKKEKNLLLSTYQRQKLILEKITSSETLVILKAIGANIIDNNPSCHAIALNKLIPNYEAESTQKNSINDRVNYRLKNIIYEFSCTVKLSSGHKIISLHRVDSNTALEEDIIFQFPKYPVYASFLEKCINATKNAATYPSTFEYVGHGEFIPFLNSDNDKTLQFVTTVNWYGYSVDIDYNAKNSFGALLPGTAKCTANFGLNTVHIDDVRTR